MKIRRDFVTNSSSSSFITFKIDSEYLKDFFVSMRKKLKDRGVDVSYRGSVVRVEADDLYSETPQNMMEFLDVLNDFLDYVYYAFEYQDDDKFIPREDYSKVLASIKKVSWTTNDDTWDGEIQTEKALFVGMQDETIRRKAIKFVKENGFCDRNKQFTEDDIRDAMKEYFYTKSLFKITEHFSYDKEKGKEDYIAGLKVEG